MRWDIRRPWRRFADRFVLSAGHTVPLVYATLAVLNETLRARVEPTATRASPSPTTAAGRSPGRTCSSCAIAAGCPATPRWRARRSSSSSTPGRRATACRSAAGEALALKLAGAEEVKVFVVEGEGGLTPGASHETRNSAWGLGLSNLVFLVDWNDFGIDERPASSVVFGTPADWFAPLRLARGRHGAGHGVGTGHPGRAGRRPRPEPRARAVDGLVPDPQGPRLRQVRRRQPRHARTP